METVLLPGFEKSIWLVDILLQHNLLCFVSYLEINISNGQFDLV